MQLQYGGDKLSPGSSIVVSWNSSDIDSSKELELILESEDKGILYVVERGLSLNGDYTWVIPNDTVTAYDYTLSLGTNDKGPSTLSEPSVEFAIYSDNNHTYEITDFSAGVLSKGDGHIGKINVEYETNAPLNKEYYLKMNITCPEDLKITGDSAKIKCNSWTGLDDKNNEYDLEYENNTNNILHINFVLDLYKNDGTLVQRKFIGPFNISPKIENYQKKDLDLSVNKYEVMKFGNAVIRFNDIGADYYLVDAFCDAGVTMTGTNKFDCVSGKGEAEKVYPTGKDVIRFDALSFANNTNSNKNVRISVSARTNDDSIIGSDVVNLKVYGAQNQNEKPEIKTNNASDTAILKLVINILKADGSSNNTQLVQILELVISLLEK